MPTGAYRIGSLGVGPPTPSVHGAVAGDGGRVGVQRGLVHHVLHRRCPGRVPTATATGAGPAWFFGPTNGQGSPTGHPVIGPAVCIAATSSMASMVIAAV